MNYFILNNLKDCLSRAYKSHFKYCYINDFPWGYGIGFVQMVVYQMPVEVLAFAIVFCISIIVLWIWIWFCIFISRLLYTFAFNIFVQSYINRINVVVILWLSKNVKEFWLNFPVQLASVSLHNLLIEESFSESNLQGKYHSFRPPLSILFMRLFWPLLSVFPCHIKFGIMPFISFNVCWGVSIICEV